MPSAQARVVTDRPARYGKQLCDHLGHKLATSWDGERGVIPLPGGKARCELDATGEALVLTAWGRDAGSLASVQDVTARHLEKFGARSELTVTWEPLDAEADRALGAGAGTSAGLRTSAVELAGKLRRRLHR